MTKRSLPTQAGFATRAIHVGQEPDAATGAVVPPIHLATTFMQDGVGNRRQDFEYSRTDNPTRRTLEECLASLEGADHCYAFASGLAATTTLLLTLSAGDHVIFSDDVYGGTFRLFDKVLTRYGVAFSTADMRDPNKIEAVWQDTTKLVWVETPTNPLLRVVDIAAIAVLAHQHKALVCVDNTFATPVLQQPLMLGADVVLYSTTKYLGGHSDVVGGAVLTSHTHLGEQVRFLQNAVGAVPSPFDCWLLLRGLKTLSLRMGQHCRNAAEVAAFLENHPAVKKVFYPGLSSHPQHQLAEKQMRDFGGMISFEVKDEATALETLSRLHIFALAESLGAVESLAEHPGRMTHASIPTEHRHAVGVSDGLIRLSVGIEDVADLIEDLQQALPA